MLIYQADSLEHSLFLQLKSGTVRSLYCHLAQKAVSFPFMGVLPPQPILLTLLMGRERNLKLTAAESGVVSVHLGYGGGLRLCPQRGPPFGSPKALPIPPQTSQTRDSHTVLLRLWAAASPGKQLEMQTLRPHSLTCRIRNYMAAACKTPLVILVHTHSGNCRVRYCSTLFLVIPKIWLSPIHKHFKRPKKWIDCGLAAFNFGKKGY